MHNRLTGAIAAAPGTARWLLLRRGRNGHRWRGQRRLPSQEGAGDRGQGAVLGEPDNGFNVIVLVVGDTTSASKKAVKQLKSAGSKVKSMRAAEGAVVTVLRSTKFKVELAATPTGNQGSVNYVVTPR